MSIQTIRPGWPAPQGVTAGCSTRVGGVSEGAYASLNLGAHVTDVLENVTENRRRLVKSAGLPAEPAWLKQVHGNQVHVVDNADAIEVEADAAVSLDGRSVLGILTADCLPILVCSTTGPELAAMHCGWRSLAGGIVGRTIAKLSREPRDLLVWLGPAISQAAFEVGDDVRDLFLAGIDDAAACFQANDNGRWQANLYGLARLHLAKEGVTQIFGGEHCTFGEPGRFYSYRRDGQCGRMASFICRVPGVL